jgi:hypothetical protein
MEKMKSISTAQEKEPLSNSRTINECTSEIGYDILRSPLPIKTILSVF